jgi:hypothetical protein
MASGPRVRDQRTALLAGAVCLAAGTFLIYDAYDARGSRRPVWLSFLPGL